MQAPFQPGCLVWPPLGACCLDILEGCQRFSPRTLRLWRAELHKDGLEAQEAQKRCCIGGTDPRVPPS